MYKRHRHSYKLARRHAHPAGYLFHCNRCERTGLNPWRFMRREKFWSEGVYNRG